MMEDKRGQEVTTELTEQKFAPCAEFPLIAKAQGENAQKVCLKGERKAGLATSRLHLEAEPTLITEVLEAKHSRVTRGVEALGPEVEIPIQALMELESKKGREADCEREKEIIRKIATKQGRLKLLGGGKTGSAPIKSTPTPISSTSIMGVQRSQTAGNDEAVIVEGLDITEEVLAWRSIPEQKMRNSQTTESEGGSSQGTDLYCFDYLSVDARNGQRCTKRVCGLKHEYPAECDLARVRKFY